MKKEYKKFEAGFQEEVVDLLVLTSEGVGGAGLYAKGIWQPSAQILGCVELSTGRLRAGKGCLYWLCEDSDKNGWIHNLRHLTIYHVKCRESVPDNERQGIPAGLWMLLEVVERDLHHPELDRILAEYQRSVEITDPLCGHFVLERNYDWFSAEVDWLGEECGVSLTCDEEGGETAEEALSGFRRIYGNLQEWDRNFRAFAASELTELANDWREDSEEDSQPITEESFAERICISEFTMETEGNYVAYYDDDDMFFFFFFFIEGNIETGMERANIAG